MFRNTQVSMIIVAGILMAITLGFCTSIYPVSGANSSETNYDGIKTVPVEDVLASPQNFTGTIGVIGQVGNIDQSKSMFFLSCKLPGGVSCACAKMPVKYAGQMPSIGSDIIVYGEVITTDEGKYMFQGEEAKPQ